MTLTECEMRLSDSPSFLDTTEVLLLSESIEDVFIGSFWTLTRYGSLFICTNPLLEDEYDGICIVATIS